MKNLQELLLQDPVFLNNWANKFDVMSSYENLYMSKEEFEATEAPYANTLSWENKKTRAAKLIEEWQDVNILFASYGEDNYSGDAWVLFEKEGKLFEVTGSHCSCYGLEDQWEPEETALEAIKMRLEKGNLGKDDYSGNEFADELKKYLGI